MLALGLALLAGCRQGSSPVYRLPPPQDSVRVTIVEPLSGDRAAFGQGVVRTLQVEAERINLAGGVGGRSVAIVALDGAGAGARSADLVRQAAADGQTRLVVGPSFDDVYQAAAPAIAAGGIPECAPALVDERLPAQAGAGFSPGTTAGARVGAAVAQARSAGARRIGLVADQDARGTLDRQAFARQVPARGGVVAATLTLSAAEPAGPALQQLGAAGAEAVLLPEDPGAAGRLVRAAREAGARWTAIGFAASAQPAFTAAAGPAATGTYAVAPQLGWLGNAPPESWNPAYRELVTVFVNRYGFAVGADGTPALEAVPAAADCLLEWAGAVRVAGSLDPRRVLPAWERLDLAGGGLPSGGRATYGDAHLAITRAESLYRYRWESTGGTPQLIQVQAPRG